jgi:hypothetical protein
MNFLNSIHLDFVLFHNFGSRADVCKWADGSCDSLDVDGSRSEDNSSRHFLALWCSSDSAIVGLKPKAEFWALLALFGTV